MAKVKIVKKTLKDNNLVEMFNEMLGGDGDPEIIAGKLTRVRALSKTVATVMRGFASGPFRRDFPEYTEWCDDFATFAEKTEALQELDYSAFKEANQTKQLVLICRDLVTYAHFLEEGRLQEPDGRLRDRWIITHPGMVYEPFSFTKFDLKHIWDNDRVVAKLKQYILTMISIMYNRCHEIYRTITSPDIDVKKFSAVIIESIEKVKSMPELSRCRNAFNKIRESVSMLENNFSTYYKDMVQSENPNTLIESFIMDVSQGQNMNISLMREFRTIINFYRKQSAGKVKDPKVKKLFDSLNARMDMLEQRARAGTSEAPDESSSDEEAES